MVYLVCSINLNKEDLRKTIVKIDGDLEGFSNRGT